MRRRHIGDDEHLLPVAIYPTVHMLGDCLAEELLDAITAAAREGRPFLLGCPGGRSLQPVYQAMGRRAGQRQADLSHVYIVMMDDYVFPTADGHAHCDADAHYSCRRFALEDIRQVLNVQLPAGQRIPLDHVWFPDPMQPAEYDLRIQQAGGIDIFLIASGASDGHVAFNPPGSGRDATSRVVPLAESTRRDNLATFPQFTGLHEVPSFGVTIGIGSITDLSRQVILVIHGTHKQYAVRQLATYGDFHPAWPATIIYRCAQKRVVLDEAAAAGLEAAQCEMA
ncbi:MAG: 6-phosphogluconolactonase [Armatimonadota bacterium]